MAPQGSRFFRYRWKCRNCPAHGRPAATPLFAITSGDKHERRTKHGLPRVQYRDRVGDGWSP